MRPSPPLTKQRQSTGLVVRIWLPLAAWLALAISFAHVDRATARDLGALSQLLTPAYTAMQYAGLCVMERQWSFSQPRGMRGTAINYAEHVKDETISALSYENTVTVLKAAADAARAEARLQLKTNVISSDLAIEAIRFRLWCEDYVTGFIRDFINKHDDEHETFLEQLNLAKRIQLQEGENDNGQALWDSKISRRFALPRDDSTMEQNPFQIVCIA